MRIEPLTKENYDTWKIQAEALINQNRLRLRITCRALRLNALNLRRKKVLITNLKELINGRI